MASRLSLAGMNVAYGNINYPTGGPFPIKWVSTEAGIVVIAYDHPFKYHTMSNQNETSSSGFSVCAATSDDKCDASSLNWSSVPASSVATVPEYQMIIVKMDPSARKVALAYLWQDTPTKEMTGLPIYGVQRANILPGAPFKTPLFTIKQPLL